MAAPTTKIARQAAIREILATRGIRSQAELSDALGDRGLSVTQGTLSRDLVELGAYRVRGADGHLVYAVPGEGGDRTSHVGEFATFEGRLARLCGEVLVSAEAHNLWPDIAEPVWRLLIDRCIAHEFATYDRTRS